MILFSLDRQIVVIADILVRIGSALPRRCGIGLGSSGVLVLGLGPDEVPVLDRDISRCSGLTVSRLIVAQDQIAGDVDHAPLLHASLLDAATHGLTASAVEESRLLLVAVPLVDGNAEGAELVVVFTLFEFRVVYQTALQVQVCIRHSVLPFRLL